MNNNENIQDNQNIEIGKQLSQEWKNISLSHATLRADDIFRAVKFLLPENLINDYENAKDQEEKEIILNENIWNYLDQIAPEGCYFGNTEGNGSDFGFWEYEEEFEEEFNEGEED
jgi:hypothetical protein